MSPRWGAGLVGSSIVLAVALVSPNSPSLSSVVAAAVAAFIAVGVGTKTVAIGLVAGRERRRSEAAAQERLRQLEAERQRRLVEEQRRAEEAERIEIEARQRRAREQWERENARRQQEYDEREREDARRVEEHKQRRRDEQELKRRALERLDGWKRLSPYDFEKEVARVLSACGAQTTVTAQSADGGVDIEVAFEGRKYAVQCKRFASAKVGGPDCQKLLGVVISESYTGGIIVTTSRLSTKARDFCAKNKLKLVAIVGTDLVKLASAPNADALRMVVRNCQK